MLRTDDKHMTDDKTNHKKDTKNKKPLDVIQPHYTLYNKIKKNYILYNSDNKNNQTKISNK